VAQLLRRQQEQHRGRHGPAAPQRLVGDAHVRCVRRHHDDAVARPDTEPPEPAGYPRGPLEQLAGGEPATLEVQPEVAGVGALEGPFREPSQVMSAVDHVRSLADEGS
jgi:hypothetical protein